jgi:maltose-binding protein MalE
MKNRRKLAFFIAVALIAALFAGCGGKTDPESTTAVESQAGTTKVATTEKVTLDGYEFTLATAFVDKFIPVKDRSEMDNRQISEYDRIQLEYDFKLNLIAYEGTDDVAVAAALAGEKIGDFIMLRHSDFFPLAASGYLKPLDGDELKAAGLDVTDSEKWDQEYTEMSLFDGHIWALSTNGEFYPFTFGYQLAFNETITMQAGYNKKKIYSLVESGDWTWDVFLTICSKVTKDLDSDGILDQFGNTSWIFGAEILTNKTNPIYQDNTGKWVCDFTNQGVIDGLEFLRDSQKINIVKSDVTSNGDLRKQFTNGNAAFVTVYYWHLVEQIFKDSSVEYGLVPLPKGPNADTYVHIVPDLDAWVMLVSNKEYQKSVVAMNAWGDIMTDDLWKDAVKQVFKDETSWENFNKYVLPNTILNNLKITSEIWSFYQENISTPIRLDIALPSVVGEQYNSQIQALLDSALNK